MISVKEAVEAALKATQDFYEKQPPQALQLEEVEMMENGEVKKKLGTVFIRGDTIILISPSD